MPAIRRLRTTSTLLLLPLLLALAAPGRATTFLEVDLQTNYEPAVEFTAVGTRLTSMSDPTFVRGSLVPAFSFTDYVSPPGVRIAEFEDLPTGSYWVTVDLLDSDGITVARQPLELVLGAATNTLAVMPRPGGVVDKSAALLLDADGDGAPSGGDTLRYSIVALGSGGERFVDELSPGLALVAGSVTTTHGLVLEGNGPADTRVEIVDMDLTAAGTALIEFDAVIAPEVSNQGEMLFESGSFDPAAIDTAYYSRRIHSNDPETLPPGDPTRTPVSCDLAECAGDLDECSEDLGMCEDDLATCGDDLTTCEVERAALQAQVTTLEEALATVLGDDDGDGTPAILDLCPGSEPGAPVDDRGCTIAQFCATIDLSQPQGNNLCNHADWLGDEPLGNPGDCRPVGSACVPD
jgi:hypothetical protein